MNSVTWMDEYKSIQRWICSKPAFDRETTLIFLRTWEWSHSLCYFVKDFNKLWPVFLSLRSQSCARLSLTFQVDMWHSSCRVQPRIFLNIFTVNDKKETFFTIYCRYTYNSRPTTLSATVCLWLCLIRYRQCVSYNVPWVHLWSISFACIVCTFVTCMFKISTLCATMLRVCACTCVFT